MLQIDEAVLDHVVKGGYKSVVNLRKESEPNMEKEAELVKARGLTYLSFPITASADGIDAKQLRAAADAIHPLPQPVFVHCASGGRASAAVLAHDKIYHGKPATLEDMVSAAASSGFVYNANWQKNLKEEFFP